MLKTYYNSLNLGYPVEVYETLHGYHIHIFIPRRKPEINLHVREILGDCKNRLELDHARLRHHYPFLIDTLFNYKKVNGVEGRETKINPLSEPWWNIK